MSARPHRLTSAFCRAAFYYCVLGNVSPSVSNAGDIEGLLRLLERVLTVGNLPGTSVSECLGNLDLYEVGMGLHAAPLAYSNLESLRDECMALLKADSSPGAPIAYALVYKLAERIFEPINAASQQPMRAIVFRDPKLENAELYYWFTRWLPPDQLQAAAEVRHNARFNIPISKTELVDHHIHLTAYHTSLVARLLYADRRHVRPLMMQASRVQARKILNAHITALIALVAQLVTYHCCVTGGVPGRGVLVNNVRLALAALQAAAYARAAWRLRSLLAVLTRQRAAPTLSPLMLLTRARDAHEAERLLHERCEAAGWPGCSGHAYTVYLAAASLLHSYLTFSELYESLELMSRAYQRAELGKIRHLINRVYHQGLQYYYSRVRLEPKISGSYKNWRIARYVAHALRGTSGAPPFPVLYLSMVKREKDCRGRGSVLCWRAVTRAYSAVRVALTLLRRTPGRLGVAHRIGLDVAGEEKRVPNWPYIHHILYARSRAPEILVSFHAGEDFYHTFNGLRKIWEALHYAELKAHDRIGHGVALYTEPGLIREERETLLEALGDVAFALLLERRLSTGTSRVLESLAFQLCNKAGLVNCNPHALVEAYETLNRPQDLLATLLQIAPQSPLTRHLRSITTPSSSTLGPLAQQLLDQLLHDPRVARRLYEEKVETRIIAGATRSLAARLQEELRDELRSRGVVIESCPTSNHAVVGVEYGEHPLPRMVEDLDVYAASDDPSLLATDVITEEKVVEAMLSQAQRLSDRLRTLKSLF